MNVVEMTGEFVSYNSASQFTNVPVSKAIAKRMREAGLKVETLSYNDANGVPKMSVVGKKGKGTGGIALMGHSDVVPAEGWAWDPFKLTRKNGRLYGRGSADMKGSVACMIDAASRLSARDLKQPIYVVATSDEEINCGGADYVHRHSRTLKEGKVRFGIIGEPTLLNVVVAHKGSYKVSVTARGKATHSSTGRGMNANHKMVPFLNEIIDIGKKLDKDPKFLDKRFTPPNCTMNIVMGDGNTAANITAPLSSATINCRAMPGQNWSSITKRIRALAKRHDVSVKIWDGLRPLDTPVDSRVVQEALSVTGKRTTKTVSYGTDGMVFGKTMECVVLGPGDIKQAHTIDEWILPEQLKKGVDVFGQMIARFCIEDPA
ncbi:MAG: acetylornithine deacetylase [Gemmatimonadetes bacterium]|nr:acetylornithine deacetylase [Gemmatimonadota bacterium]|tara:strand:- start:9281 stop:10405 length:1125 start_codon:yes stop_codon:yes gene_type:complete